jgi:hypothetical protein
MRRPASASVALCRYRTHAGPLGQRERPVMPAADEP